MLVPGDIGRVRVSDHCAAVVPAARDPAPPSRRPVQLPGAPAVNHGPRVSGVLQDARHPVTRGFDPLNDAPMVALFVGVEPQRGNREAVLPQEAHDGQDAAERAAL